jgi:hypothetical protein
VKNNQDIVNRDTWLDVILNVKPGDTDYPKRGWGIGDCCMQIDAARWIAAALGNQKYTLSEYDIRRRDAWLVWVADNTFKDKWSLGAFGCFAVAHDDPLHLHISDIERWLLNASPSWRLRFRWESGPVSWMKAIWKQVQTEVRYNRDFTAGRIKDNAEKPPITA